MPAPVEIPRPFISSVEDSAPPEPPLGGYVVLLSIFASAAGTFAWRFAASGRDLPERVAPADFALLTVAAHKLARVISHDRVLRPVRAPFTELQADAGPGEVSERPRPGTRGLRHALGDLLVCPFCLGMWTTTALFAGLLRWPRATRWGASILASFFGTELLQVVYRRVVDDL
ncbi:MAG TPA: DUF1360 domain-containing protein [Solirubrobacteraceae bacterium]|nr:DUF1360 domain-containing protein [Solirubrobacteraceae bacterium]